MASAVKGSCGRNWIRWLAVGVALLLALFLWPAVRIRLEAAAILIEEQGRPLPGWLARFAGDPVSSKVVEIPYPDGPVQARLYWPTRRPTAPGIVIVPGVHYLGMNEPRLVAFARGISACGLQVLTPDLKALKDYQVNPGIIPEIGASSTWLAALTGHRVGLTGLSFSGGLALMAAAHPQVGRHIRFVLAVGAHDDMERVAIYYATGVDPLPRGGSERLKPDDYGPLIIEYDYLESFTKPEDRAALHAVLEANLHEDWREEKQLTEQLTPAQKGELRTLQNPHAESAAIIAVAKSHAAEMAAVSPHGHLAGLRSPVYLLHGEGDDVVPAAEMAWLKRDLPPGTLQQSLTSPIISHVGVEGGRGRRLWNEWRVVNLMAGVLGAAEDSRWNLWTRWTR